jgi:hypothetical protein
MLTLILILTLIPTLTLTRARALALTLTLLLLTLTLTLTTPRWAHLLLNDTNATNATEDSTTPLEDSMVGRMLGVKVAGEAAAVDMTGTLGVGVGLA